MRRIDSRRGHATAQRSTGPSIGWQEFINLFGRNYTLSGSPGLNPAASFTGYVRDVTERSGVVAGAIAARALLISQIQFTWRNNRTSPTFGRAFGNPDLAILERPGPVTRPELLHLAEQDVSNAGSWYCHRNGNELHRLRPDWVTVILGSNEDPVDNWIPPDARIIGYGYGNPATPSGRRDVFLPSEMIHWKPEPHPLEWWRGASWITSVLTEIRNDGQATDHTSKFFEKAATPNLVFKMDPTLTAEQVQEYADLTNRLHAGSENAYKNMFLGGGTDVIPVGHSAAALDLQGIQGGYETRIAVRSQVPAVVLGIREGLGGSALNSGNYSVARRLWADKWFTPTVQNLCAAVERVMRRPTDSDLWYDPSQVLFLQEDQKDAADIQSTKAVAIRNLTDAGFEWSSVIAAIENDDFNLLRHNGLFSVQLQPPGSPAAAPS